MTAAGLALSWITDPAGLDPLAQDWRALADRVGADGYMRPDWQAVWWRHFGAGRQLACLAARGPDGQLVALLPFQIQRIWFGPLPLRLARLAGTDPHCVVLQPPLDPAWAQPVLAAAVRHLTGPLGALAVSFTPVSDLAAHLAPLRALATAEPGLILREAPEGVHVVFDLPDAFDSFLDRLTKKRRAQFRRDLRGLADAFGMTHDAIEPDPAAFADFVAFHAAQWQAVGRGGHFADWPGSAGFYTDLAAASAGSGLMQFDRMLGTDGPLATEFSLLAGPTAHWRLPARRLDPEAERLSAGKALMLLMFQRMIALGVRRVEGGRGSYGYKIDYGGRNVDIHQLILARSGPGARLGLAWMLAWARGLNLAYYRIWFLRLLPRLRQATGLAPRPLWTSWIRTRL